MRAAYKVLKGANEASKRPCSHVEGLPPGARYAAVHYRCGDFMDTHYSGAVTRGERGHTFLGFSWFSFLPEVLVRENIHHIVLLGNRRVHSDKEEYANACVDLFDKFKLHLERITGATVHIAPELNDGRVGLVRDSVCMTQSRVLVVASIASTFAYWQTLLHAGCASFHPYHTNDTHLFSQRRIYQGQRFVAARPHDLVRLADATPEELIAAISGGN